MQVLFRAFKRDDIEALFFLDQRCYVSPYRFSYPQLLGTLMQRDVAAMVIEREEERDSGLVGGLIVRGEREKRRASVISLMIDEAFRRQGLGSRLLGWAAGLARGQDGNALLVPVAAGNEVGAAFLTANGFRDTGECEPYFSDAGEGSVWTLALDNEPRP